MAAAGDVDVPFLGGRDDSKCNVIPTPHSAALLHSYSVIIESDASTGASVATCALNLLLSTVGVGALTLPWSTASVGWLQSGLLLLLFFLVSVYNLYLLDNVCRALPPGGEAGSYAAVVGRVLGRPGAYALEGFMLMYSFGLSVSYLGVVGTEVSVLAKLLSGDAGATDPAWLDANNLMALVSALLVLPLSLLPDRLLRLSGAVGTLCMLLTTIVVVSMVPWRSQPPFVAMCADALTLTGSASAAALEPVVWISSPKALLSAVPMFSFCMNAATAFVSIRSQMAAQGGPGRPGQPPRSAVLALIWSAQSFALVDYAVGAAAGYATFCGAAPDNVLDGFPASHLPSLAARAALALQLAAACAGVYLPLARAALSHLVFGLSSGAPAGASRVAATVALVAGMVLVARLLDGALALPLGLTSAVCTTAIMFVFPGLCASRTQAASAPLAAKAAPLLFAAAGLAIGTASTATLLVSS